jgi:hypothetical protein
MRFKKIKLSAIFLLSFGLTGMQAQNSLYVKEKTGKQTSFALNSIRKLTFPLGNMVVNKTNGITSTYALSDIRYMNFTNLTTIASLSGGKESEDIKLYPNPVVDHLQISFKSIKAGKASVQIFDLDGKVLLQQTINIQDGTNNSIISVSELPEGLYILHLQNGNKLESIKFLKK